MSYSVQFEDQSIPGPSGAITAWLWDFGDNETSTEQNPLHEYATAGDHSVTLHVTSPDGTASVTHIVNTTPSVTLLASFSATPLTGETPLTVNITDYSTPGPHGPIIAYDYNWGDGSTHANTANPSHVYNTEGTYTITLTVTGTGTDGTAVHTVSVIVTAQPPVGSDYRPYIDASTLNKTIPTPAPVHASSATMLSTETHWLLGGTSSDQYKEWMGPGQRAVYAEGDTSDSQKFTPTSVYANNNGWVGAGPFTVPLPTWAAEVLGPKCQTGDSYIVIVNLETGAVWELWHTTPPGYTPRDSGFPNNRWNCSAYRYWPTGILTTKGYTSSYNTNFHPSTSASKIQIPCGLIIPEDFEDCWGSTDPGTVISHALRLDTFCGSNGTAFPRSVLPAAAGDGQQPNGAPCGARIQLDPSIDFSPSSTWASVNSKPLPWRFALRKILRTLQVYGAIPVDSMGGIGAGMLEAATKESVAKGGVNYPVGYEWPWDASGFIWGYNGVPYDLMSRFRVIDWTVWTGS